jgi:hypothetical protein
VRKQTKYKNNKTEANIGSDNDITTHNQTKQSEQKNIRKVSGKMNQVKSSEEYEQRNKST